MRADGFINFMTTSVSLILAAEIIFAWSFFAGPDVRLLSRKGRAQVSFLFQMSIVSIVGVMVLGGLGNISLIFSNLLMLFSIGFSAAIFLRSKRQFSDSHFSLADLLNPSLAGWIVGLVFLCANLLIWRLKYIGPEISALSTMNDMTAECLLAL